MVDADVENRRVAAVYRQALITLAPVRATFVSAFGVVPLVGEAAIFAARRAALLLVLGTIVGGEATLSRFCFGAGVCVAELSVVPLTIPLTLFASEERLRGFAGVEGAELEREVVREIGRAEMLS